MDFDNHQFPLRFKLSTLIPPKSNSADLMTHQEWFKSWLTIKYTVPKVFSDFKTFGTIPAL